MKRGRPTSYRRSFPDKAFKLWVKGATDLEVCKALKVSRETLDQFAKRHPEFLAAKLSAKHQANQLVERALFKRATGFVAPDSHVSQFDGQVTVTALEKHYPPDTAAIVFWLKNRLPKEWRDRSEMLLEQEIAGVPPDVCEALRKRFLGTTRSGN